jgi:uncharacterized protein (DUF1800 family)
MPIATLLQRISCAVLIVAATFATPARAQDAIFSDSYELAFDVPANNAEAARFLNQASFGATPTDITLVRQIGVSGWINQQIANPTVTLSRNWMEQYGMTLAGTTELSQADRVQRWYQVAATAPDQLRQKLAYALSQMIVVSDGNDTLGGEEVMMAEWNDILVRNALGNYRDLLIQTTYSPMMGIYLTTKRNRKFELVRQTGAGGVLTGYTVGNNGVQPDENYAREVQQLFSIGLVLRNNDFSIIDGDPGTPVIEAVPTYDEETISTLARVFTGLSHNCSGNRTIPGTSVTISRTCAPSGGTCPAGDPTRCRFTNAQSLFDTLPPRQPGTQRGLVHPDFYEPMVCYPRYHDNGRDTSGAPLPDPDSPPFPLPAGSPPPDKTFIVNGAAPLVIGPSIIPSTSAPVNCHATGTGDAPVLSQAEREACVAYCEGNINASIDLLFNHPNTPPMVARQLIQRLVTSNPSPQYIERVAQAFIDNGSGVRGDLRAVVRAIFFDIEARRPATDPAQPVDFGKPREPLLKLVQLWRNFGYVSGDTGNLPSGLTGRRRWGPDNPQDNFQQRPLGAPSVFNFYEPDYIQPGVIADRGLFSPEFQIIHEVSTVNTSNELFARICSGYGGNSNNCSGGVAIGIGVANSPTDRAFLPSSVIDAFPTTNTTDPAALANVIEFYNERMLGGTMSGTISFGAGNDCFGGSLGTGTKGRLYRLLRCNLKSDEGGSGITGGTPAEQNRRRHLYLMHLVAISPDYHAQR